MAKLKRVDNFSAGFVMGVLTGILGVVAGIIYSFGGLIYDAIKGQLGFGTILAFGALIGMPVLFAVFGFMLGYIGASINNLVASHKAQAD